MGTMGTNQRRTWQPGDLVRADYMTGDHPPQTAWYRARVIGPSTQRPGDYFVEVIETSPNSRVTVGARLSPITGAGWDLTADSRSAEQ